MRADLHLHTFYSDSFSSPENVVREAFIKRLDCIAITDHNEFAGAKRAVEYAREKGLAVIAGEEVMTDKGEVIGLFLQEKVKRGGFPEVVDGIRAQGGLVVFPHPCDRLRHGILAKDSKLARFADGIESFNARVIFAEDNEKARAAATSAKKAQIGGSDAHFLFEIGAGWTEFEGSGDPAEELRKAIGKRKTTAGGRQSIPFVHGFGKVAKALNRFRR